MCRILEPTTRAFFFFARIEYYRRTVRAFWASHLILLMQELKPSDCRIIRYLITCELQLITETLAKYSFILFLGMSSWVLWSRAMQIGRIR